MAFESMTLEMRADLFAALSDPIRLRILDELGGCKTCVCDLQQTIDVAPNLLSYHLRVLREAGLVVATRRGRWVDYELAPSATDLITAASPLEL
ncbi:MAG: metalloregulator ArsR/SmtB family transcription factor [Acidimicrobiia bacterium]|nr:metalloregulator ArsR/SmtB family transcription factor [Acidimicrobiia bacterium]